MGQYYIVANLDTGEYVTGIDSGIKLLEHVYNTGCEGSAAKMFHILTAVGNGRGGGDFPTSMKVEGSVWSEMEPHSEAKRRGEITQEAFDALYEATKKRMEVPAFPVKLPDGKQGYLDTDAIVGRWAGARVLTLGDYAEWADLSLDPLELPYATEANILDDVSRKRMAPYEFLCERGSCIDMLLAPLLEWVADGYWVANPDEDAYPRITFEGLPQDQSAHREDWERNMAAYSPDKRTWWDAYVKAGLVKVWYAATSRKVRMAGPATPVSVRYRTRAVRL